MKYMTLCWLGFQFFLLCLGMRYLPATIYTHFSNEVGMPRSKTFILVVWGIYASLIIIFLIIRPLLAVKEILIFLLALSSFELLHLYVVNLYPTTSGHILWYIPCSILFLGMMWKGVQYRKKS
jgi:uncharacterized membrane protein (DUF106 family)